MDFKLRKEQIHFKISFINEILSKVEYLTENAYFSMNENQSLKLNSLKLEMFKNKIKHDNIFFENISKFG